MSDKIKEIGMHLAKGSTQVFSAARGFLPQIYPHLLIASQRMSTHAISAWLDENYSISISAVTIAKALREPGKNWPAYFWQIMPKAALFEKWHQVPMEEFLFDIERFKLLNKNEKDKALDAMPETRPDVLNEAHYDMTYAHLWDDWFGFDETVRESGYEHLAKVISEYRAQQKKDQPAKAAKGRNSRKAKGGVAE